MSWPPRFLFISNRLSIDFAQTGGVGKWAALERWNAPSDLADWFGECSLQLELTLVRPSDLVAARVLREAIWNAARAIVQGRRVPPESVSELHASAARPDLVPELTGSTVEWAPGATVRQALSTVARDAIELFGGDQRARLRECQNPRCPLLFVDTSRPGKRAWCTMKRCGNLQKTARYRASLKATRGAKTGKRR